MANHSDLLIELDEVGDAEAHIIESMLDDYLAELSRHRDLAVGASDSASYRHLDAYWSERGRHAFVIRAAAGAVGFALVREPASTGSSFHQMAEFYIRHESRRLGVGRRAVRAIWERFPGDWELQVHARNSAAIRFWGSCAEAEASTSPRVRHVQASDGRRVQFNFSVGTRHPTGRS